MFVGGRATAFIDWDGIFVSTPMWDLAHAVWQFAPVCDDADRWLGGWPSPPDQSVSIAAPVGGCRLADELADMEVEVIAGAEIVQPEGRSQAFEKTMRVVSEVDSTVRRQLDSGSQRGAPARRCLKCRAPKRRNPGRLPKQGRFRGFQEASYSVTAPAPQTVYDVRVVAKRLTAARMGPYLDDSAGDYTAALRLYDWNSAVAGAMHADLGRLEVVFRNAVDLALTSLAASKAWTQPWYVQESLFRGRSGEVAREAVASAVHRASRRKRRTPGHGGVIVELGFGFWRFLCGPANLTALWVPALASAFPQHPAQGDPRRIRAEVEHRMERLHLLRNRIAHHEPIFRRDLERDHSQLLELIGWICVDSRTWVAAVSRTPETIAERSR